MASPDSRSRSASSPPTSPVPPIRTSRSGPGSRDGIGRHPAKVERRLAESVGQLQGVAAGPIIENQPVRREVDLLFVDLIAVALVVRLPAPVGQYLIVGGEGDPVAPAQVLDPFRSADF